MWLLLSLLSEFVEPYTRVRAYQGSPMVKKFLQKLMALGYLPLLLVRQNVFLFIGSNRSNRLMRRHPSLRNVVQYIGANYFNGQFIPDLWNVFHRDHVCTINNHVEGFHSLGIVKQDNDTQRYGFSFGS